jgi:hypothetical protein
LIQFAFLGRRPTKLPVKLANCLSWVSSVFCLARESRKFAPRFACAQQCHGKSPKRRRGCSGRKLGKDLLVIAGRGGRVDATSLTARHSHEHCRADCERRTILIGVKLGPNIE